MKLGKRTEIRQSHCKKIAVIALASIGLSMAPIYLKNPLKEGITMVQPVYAEKSDKRTELENLFPADAAFFDPKQKFGGLGVVEGMTLRVMPSFWGIAKDKMAERLKEMKLDKDERIAVLYNYVFSSEETYKEFLEAPNQQQFLMDLIVGYAGGATATVPGAAGTAPVTTVTQTTILSEDRLPVSKFLSAFKALTFKTQDLYDSVLRNAELTASEKKEFMQFFVTIHTASPELGQAFLLTMFDVISKSRADFEENFETRFEQQIRTMRNIWGPTMSNHFEGFRHMNKGSLTVMERYMEVVYANLCLGSVLIGGGDIPMRASMGRLFTLGFLGGITGIIDQTAGQSLEYLRDLTGVSAKGSQELLTGVVAPIISFAAGLTLDITKIVMSPLIYIQKALTTNIGTKLAKEFLEASQDDRYNRIKNPHVFCALMGMVAAYGTTPTGMRGVSEVILVPSETITWQQTATPIPALPEEKKEGEEIQSKHILVAPIMDEAQRRAAEEMYSSISTARDVIDKGIIDLFIEGLKVSDPKKYKAVPQFYGAVLAMHAVIYSLKTFSLQENEVTMWQRWFAEDISPDIIETFKKMENPNTMKEVFGLILQINSNGNVKLNDIMKIYEDEGIEGLEDLLEEVKRENIGLKRVPTKKKMA